MKVPRYTGQFKKDVKLAQKRGRNIEKLKALIVTLAEAGTLEAKYRDHPLKGALSEYRECHVEPDWLIIYRSEASEITLIRTGTHSDLFG